MAKGWSNGIRRRADIENGLGTQLCDERRVKGATVVRIIVVSLQRIRCTYCIGRFCPGLWIRGEMMWSSKSN
ncbi:hypothetical protein [Salmonella enterica]|uniref:hypothetical protein n=1 Tax=Salmonella enterica TaxID=28901 RepID=UPI0020C2BFB2|nr:hypothetical protein [Salmonella enterica]